MIECKACGYKKGFDFNSGVDYDMNDGEFIKIQGNYTIDDGTYYSSYICKVNLLACPRCGTVRMEKCF